MNNLQKYLSTCVLATAALVGGAAPAWASGGGGGGTSPPSGQVTLGAASDFAVLAGTNVTCTDGVIAGDVGVSPGSAVPFTNTRCTITGRTPPATNAAAARAQIALTSAYNTIRTGDCTPLTLANTGTTVGRNLSTLAGVTLAPGTYCIDDVAKAGLLTLTGDSNGVWIFKVLQTAAGDLTGTNFSVVMDGGGQPCNVFWAPATFATMTTSALKGNILAGNAIGGSITLTGGTLAGRALAKVAVTMTTGPSVIGCDALSDSPSCKAKSQKSKKSNKSQKSQKSNKSHGYSLRPF